MRKLAKSSAQGVSEDAPADMPCWLVNDRDGNHARWWCAKCRHWHFHGWSPNDDWRRLARCCGQIRLVPTGWADAALAKRIEDDRAPPGVADPGIYMTPEIFRHQILGELARLLDDIHAHDGFAGSALEKWAGLAVRVNVWRHLHGLTSGAVHENDLAAICELAERAGKSIAEAIQTLFPHLPVDGLLGSAAGAAGEPVGGASHSVSLCGVIVTPKMAGQRARRVLAEIIENFEAADSDEFCDALGHALNMEIQVLTSWYALNARLGANVDRAYIFEVVNIAHWDHLSAEDAVTLLMPYIAKT
jgi:hypothetical protein